MVPRVSGNTPGYRGDGVMFPTLGDRLQLKRLCINILKDAVKSWSAQVSSAQMLSVPGCLRRVSNPFTSASNAVLFILSSSASIPPSCLRLTSYDLFFYSHLVSSLHHLHEKRLLFTYVVAG